MFRQTRDAGRVRRRARRRFRCRRPPRSASTAFASSSGEQQANGGFEVQEYRRPEFEVIVTPANRFVVQGNEAVATVQARYYFGQPVANARVRYVVNQQPYYSPLRWSDGVERRGRRVAVLVRRRPDASRASCGSTRKGAARFACRWSVDDNGRDYSARIEAQVTDASSREVSGNTVVHATYGLVPDLDAGQRLHLPAGAAGRGDGARARLHRRRRRPTCRSTLVLERITYPNGYYTDPDGTRSRRHADGHDGSRWHGDAHR